VLVPPGASIEPPVKPEVLDAYTVGAKTEWLDHRVRVNVEGFFYKYSDIQIQATVNSLNVLTNAASATIKGIDLDTVFEPVRNLTITANAEVLHGRYTSLEKGLLYVYQPVTGGNTTTVANLSGNDTVHSPPFSFSSSVNYKISVANLGDLALSATFSHTLSYFAGVDNAKGQSASTADRQATYSLVSTSANWTPTNGQWGVRFWGKNLTDHHYWSESSLLSFASQYSPAPPRTFGVDFTFSFGK
jgi:iron complex outermembrane receptor protein